MRKQAKPKIILLADDDEDDRLLVIDALKENHFSDVLYTVENGEELLEFLRKEGKYNSVDVTLPHLILLDLNMPRLDGREVLKALKSDSVFKYIPVVVFTTSDSERDISYAYDSGVNSFITKPMSFTKLVKVMRNIHNYWFKTSKLPINEE